MRGGHDPLNARQGQVTHIPAGEFFHLPCSRSTRMDTHTHLDRRGVPRFTLQPALRLQRRDYGITAGMECSTKRVAYDLEDIPIIGFNRLAQDRVMLCQEQRHLIGETLQQAGAALDIGEQKGDGAAWRLPARQVERSTHHYLYYWLPRVILSDQNTLRKK